MKKIEMLKINSSNLKEEKQINFMDLNKTKESFRDEKNNQNEFYKIYDKKYFDNEIKKEKKIKKVKFMEPMFVNIIEVESYKKYNEENTCKDPFENMEFVNGRLINTKKNDDEPHGKASVLCSCVFF